MAAFTYTATSDTLVGTAGDDVITVEGLGPDHTGLIDGGDGYDTLVALPTATDFSALALTGIEHLVLTGHQVDDVQAPYTFEWSQLLGMDSMSWGTTGYQLPIAILGTGSIDLSMLEFDTGLSVSNATDAAISLHGTAFQDSLSVFSTVPSAVYGGRGDDYIFMSGTQLIGHHTAYGGEGDDFLYDGVGDRSNAFLSGEAGNDVIWSTGGRATLSGGAGNDSFELLQFIGSGAMREAVVLGGSGDDFVWLYQFSENESSFAVKGRLDGGQGSDRLQIDGKWPSEAWLDLTQAAISGFESVSVNDIGLVLRLAQWQHFDQLQVSDVSLRIVGQGGVIDDTSSYHSGRGATHFDTSRLTSALTFFGENGGTDLTATRHADLLVGGSGDDTIRAGRGDDLVHGGLGGDTVFGGQGNDTIHGGHGADRPDGLVDPNNVWGRDDTYRNALNGGEGHDLIVGGTGGDRLFGGAHDDTLAGGQGADILWGGKGADMFVFDTRPGRIDIIGDFRHGEDRIALDDAVFTSLAAGSLSADALQIGTASRSENVRILYEMKTGKLSYDADGSGDGAAIQFATLKPWLALTADDFEII